MPFKTFEEEITICWKKIKPMIQLIKCEKYANLCRIYDMHLRLKKNNFKKRKFKTKEMWLNLNISNCLMRWIDKFYQGDQDNWNLQTAYWENT